MMMQLRTFIAISETREKLKTLLPMLNKTRCLVKGPKACARDQKTVFHGDGHILYIHIEVVFF